MKPTSLADGGLSDRARPTPRPGQNVPLSYLAQRVLSIARELVSVHDVTVFLCGKSAEDTDSVRALVRRDLNKRNRARQRIRVYYPEDVFRRAFADGARTRGRRNPEHNMLALENRLAQSADVIVIVVESEGAICELGAFTNRDEIRDRVVAVVRKHYRDDHSFIIAGPVDQLLADQRVIYHDFFTGDRQRFVGDLSEAIRRVGRRHVRDVSFDNLVLVELFAHLSAYLIEPLALETLGEMLTQADGGGGDVEMLAVASGDSLAAQGLAELGGDGIRLTAAGRNGITDLVPRASRYDALRGELDHCRVICLHRMLRRPSRWGERLGHRERPRPSQGGVSPPEEPQ